MPLQVPINTWYRRLSQRKQYPHARFLFADKIMRICSFKDFSCPDETCRLAPWYSSIILERYSHFSRRLSNNSLKIHKERNSAIAHHQKTFRNVKVYWVEFRFLPRSFPDLRKISGAQRKFIVCLIVWPISPSNELIFTPYCSHLISENNAFFTRSEGRFYLTKKGKKLHLKTVFALWILVSQKIKETVLNLPSDSEHFRMQVES